MPTTTHIHEGDGWSADGRSILSAERLAAIQMILQDKGPVIVEHRFYRGSRAPQRLVFDDYDEFIEYVKTKAISGDSFYVWDYEALCRDDNTLADGKYPDVDGRVPDRGAY